MRLSHKGEYALRAMTYLALNYRKSPVQIHEISQREKIPEKFLEQILLQLKRAGLLDSKRGSHGGYVLLKPPKRVSLADIIRTIDGALAPLGCVSKWAHVKCENEKSCGLRAVMLDVRNVVARMLEGITLEDACAGSGSPSRRADGRGRVAHAIDSTTGDSRQGQDGRRRRTPSVPAHRVKPAVKGLRRRALR
jgi:Rrf2 family cysteine metabolism transcriptional repressor